MRRNAVLWLDSNATYALCESLVNISHLVVLYRPLKYCNYTLHENNLQKKNRNATFCNNFYLFVKNGRINTLFFNPV